MLRAQNLEQLSWNIKRWKQKQLPNPNSSCYKDKTDINQRNWMIRRMAHLVELLRQSLLQIIVELFPLA